MRTTRNRPVLTLAALAATLASCGTVAICLAAAEAEEPVNLVANGDFSGAAGGKLEKWATSGSPANVAQTLSAEKDTDGKPFARLVCTHCERQGGDSHAMLAQNGQVNLIGDRLYQFSCRMRATGLASRTISVAIQETEGWIPSGLFTEFTVGPAWQQYKTMFRAARDVGPTGRLQIWFAEPGTMDVADVRIVEVAAQTIEFSDTVAPAGDKNLVPNGSFELGGADWSSMGTGVGWGDLDSLHGTIQAGGTQGKSLLRIPLGGDHTPVLYFDYFDPLVKRELRPLAVSLGWIKVEKGAAYTLSCDMRSSVAGVRAVLGVRAKDPSAGDFNDYSQPQVLTTTWRRYSLTFRPQRDWLFVFAGPDLPEEQRVDVDVDAIQLEKGDHATPFRPRTALEFAVEPSQPAGIFVEGEPNALALRLCNHAPRPATVAIDLQATDYADKPASLPCVSVDVPSMASMKRDLPLPADWKGYYQIRATAKVGGKAETAELRIAIVPPPAAGDSVCGINHAFVSADQIHLARKAGVTWYRDWSLKWQHIEPSRGEFRWERGDTQIDRVLRAGVMVLPLLPPFPSAGWNSDAPASLAEGSSYPACRLRAAFAPKEPGELATFAGKAVRQYKDRIHLWEFLNEPVYTSYALPADREGKLGGKRYTPADYVALLEVAAKGMREADPACKVIGGIAGPPNTMTREVIEAGCLKHVDVFNLHMYPGKRAPESYRAEMKDLLAMMDAHGGRKPIWITEFSYYGADNLPRRPFFPRADNWAEERLLDSERQCADYTVRFFLVMLSHGVEKVFIHSGASGRANDPNYECALFDYGSVPRKLFAALAVLTDLLGPRPVSVGESQVGDLGHAAAFETGKQSLVALWSEGDTPGPHVVIPAGESLVVVNVVGRKRAGRDLGLSGSPAYLLGPPGTAKKLLKSLKVTK
ncbi:MAG: hypothetical protein NTW96_00915 [Planctomycetia bacterium]|nr:hypothetical protein [Planctomycetia bacterium]